MTETALAHANLLDGHKTGVFLGQHLAANMVAPPDVVIVFAAPTYKHTVLLRALKEACQPHNIRTNCAG